MRNTLFPPIAIGLFVLLACSRGLSAQESTPAAATVEEFSRVWNADDWQPRDNPRRAGYLRPLNDAGWKSRMLAFRSLIMRGADAVGGVRRVLTDDSPPNRILAAQTLQFLPCQEISAELIEAAEHDDEAAVRLYAVDALGTLEGESVRDTLRRLQETEKNRDVLRHITYALERHPASPHAAAADALRKWNVERIDTARVDEVAPDFSLMSLSGENVALNRFRGVKSVVLVFVYGDT